MTKNTFFKYLTRVHKWAGLIIGIQITLWMVSGLFMSWFYIQDIRGEWIAEQTDFADQTQNIISLTQAIGLYDGEVSAAARENYAGYPVYTLSGSEGRVTLDARSGEQWSSLSQNDITRAAQSYYFGEGAIKDMTLINEAPAEYGGPIPVWKVDMDDKQRTHLYIDTDTAALHSVRTRLWRVYDLMWMLHIMDYKTRDNFNTWWLRLAAFVGLLFALTGIGLLVHRFLLRPKRIKIP